MRNMTAAVQRFRHHPDFVILSWIAGLFIAVIALGGCTGTVPEPMGPDGLQPDGSRWSVVECYVILEGDILNIRVFGCPELAQTQRVRPDGKISLQIIGDIQASGLTPAELDAAITSAYSRTIVNPEATVIMRSFRGYTVFVGGSVNRPGEIKLHGRLTARQAITCAGGYTEEAKTASVLLVRSSVGSEREIMELDLSQQHRVGSPDIDLEPFDILFVPRTLIAHVDRFVAQYIDSIVPKVFGVKLHNSYDLNPVINEETAGLPK
ncbi:polysaccharide biosynthesis/export family protein [Thermodesulfobacteriota bacterium]